MPLQWPYGVKLPMAYRNDFRFQISMYPVFKWQAGKLASWQARTVFELYFTVQNFVYFANNFTMYSKDTQGLKYA